MQFAQKPWKQCKNAVPVLEQKPHPISVLYYCPKILIHECHGNPYCRRLLFIAAVSQIKGIIIKLIINHYLPAKLRHIRLQIAAHIAAQHDVAVKTHP